VNLQSIWLEANQSVSRSVAVIHVRERLQPLHCRSPRDQAERRQSGETVVLHQAR
jgi:hypothetical protein